MNKWEVKDKLKDNKLPVGWVRTRLGSVIEKIEDGGTPPREDPTNFNGGIPWVVINDIKKRISSTKDTLSKKGLKKCNAKLWKKGSIILSFGATIGEVGITEVDLSTKQGIAGIEVKSDEIYNEFLYYVLLIKKNELLRYSNGTTIKEIRPETIKEKIKLLFPSFISEQQKIAEILETVDETIEKTDAVIEKYKRIKRGLMQNLLTKGIDKKGEIRSEKTHKFKDSPLGRIPEEWEVVELGLVGSIVSGSTPSTNKTEFWNGNIVWITPDDLSKLKNKYICTSSRKISKKGLQRCSAKMIPKNSIVISSRAPIGYLAISEVDMATNQGCKSIVLKNLFDVEFIYYCLHLYITKMIILGSGTTFSEISKTELNKLKIVIPKFKEEQQRIASILLQIDETVEKEQNYKEKLESIRQGLMEDLLTGKVRVLNVN